MRRKRPLSSRRLLDSGAFDGDDDDRLGKRRTGGRASSSSSNICCSEKPSRSCVVDLGCCRARMSFASSKWAIRGFIVFCILLWAYLYQYLIRFSHLSENPYCHDLAHDRCIRQILSRQKSLRLKVARLKSGEDKKIVRWGAHTLDLDDEESTLDNPRRYATLLEHDGRGIVLTGGGQHVKALAAQISLLRRMGCTLPIEVWHHAELDPTTCRRLAELGSKGVPVRCRSTAEVASITSTVSVHHIKLLGVMLSSFKEVLALDADTVPLRDPTSVFAIPEYADHGALFWPGLHDSSTLSQGGESTKSNHVMWTISDVSFNGSDYRTPRARIRRLR